MIRDHVNATVLFSELSHQGLSEEEVLAKIIEAKTHPGRVLEVGTYKFRFNEETAKYDDNHIQSMIKRVVEGNDARSVILDGLKEPPVQVQTLPQEGDVQDEADNDQTR